MIEIELLSKTETEPKSGGIDPRKIIMAGAVFVVIMYAVFVFIMWDKLPMSQLVVCLVSALAVVPVIYFVVVKRMNGGAPLVPSQDGSLTVSERGLVFHTENKTLEIEPDDIESLRLVFNGSYGKPWVDKIDRDGEAPIKNVVTVKLKSGEEISSPYAIKDAAQRKQLRAELRLLGKAGVNFAVRNTSDREQHFL